MTKTERKALAKFVALDLHAFGFNSHGYWNGHAWTINDEEAVLYTFPFDAEKVAKEHADQPHYTKVFIEF